MRDRAWVGRPHQSTASPAPPFYESLATSLSKYLFCQPYMLVQCIGCHTSHLGSKAELWTAGARFSSCLLRKREKWASTATTCSRCSCLLEWRSIAGAWPADGASKPGSPHAQPLHRRALTGSSHAMWANTGGPRRPTAGASQHDGDPETRESLLRKAREYELMAVEAEQRQRAVQKSSAPAT
jgi:hypothetical protein